MKVKYKALAASTLVEVLITMILSGILLLAVYDGLEIINGSMVKFNMLYGYDRLDRLEKFEILEFRSDSVIIKDSIIVFWAGAEQIDTIMHYEF